jgi:DNA-binding NtrC family response regulator
LQFEGFRVGVRLFFNMKPIKKTILVIDDEAALLEIVRDELKGDYRILTAGNGLQGLELVKSENPDLIISDITMPEMDGLTMLNQLRLEGFKKPVILITAQTGVERMKAAWDLGAFDFVEKPIDFDRLNEAVLIALEFGVGFNAKRDHGFGKVKTEATASQIESMTINLERELLNSCQKKAHGAQMTVAEWVEKVLRAAV